MNRARLGLGLAGGVATLFGVALVVAPGVARTGPVRGLSTRLVDVDTTSLVLAAGLLAAALTMVFVREGGPDEPFESTALETDRVELTHPSDGAGLSDRRRFEAGEHRDDEQGRGRSGAIEGGDDEQGRGRSGAIEGGDDEQSEKHPGAGGNPGQHEFRRSESAGGYATDRASTPTDREVERAIDAGGEAFDALVDQLTYEAAWSYAAANGCAFEQARTAIEERDWTRDRLAAGVLAGTLPVSAAVRLWLWPVAERRRRVERTVEAIERVGR